MKGRTKCQEKIAVITARADDRTQKDIICGIAEAAFAADTDVVVFSNIYNHWIRDEFLNFENIIYDFLIRAALTELLSSVSGHFHHKTSQRDLRGFCFMFFGKTDI